MSHDLSWLHHQALEAVRADPHSWLFTFSNGALLQAECPWRVVSEGRVALGNVDHDQKFGLREPIDATQLARRILADQRIAIARVQPETSDLVLEFSSGARLELFNGSSGYEGWSLTSPQGHQFIAQGGGRLVLL